MLYAGYFESQFSNDDVGKIAILSYTLQYTHTTMDGRSIVLLPVLAVASHVYCYDNRDTVITD